MDKLNRQELERIPIPEGLEERLSQKIDEWEQAENRPPLSCGHLPLYGENHSESLPLGNKPHGLPPHRGGGLGRGSAWLAAASIALVLGLGYYAFTSVHGDSVTVSPLAEQDTYHDPLLAQQEAERALTLLAANLNKGMGHLEKAKALSDRAETTLNKQLKALE
ncbi:MAG: hypothetical protein IJ635_01375 [Bacteroidaceae bacterium]|nr:hypothetical protein [Bacteroidaceae bacterium]MBR1519874.1 hypothetical protein [Bacteroidaceae bacterium]